MILLTIALLLEATKPANSVLLEKMNSLGSIPPRFASSSATYKEDTDQIILFGGISGESSTFLSSLYYFDLKNSFWGEYVPQTSIRPPGLYTPKVFMGKDNKLIVVHGKTSSYISSDIFSFDFTMMSWEKEKLLGDYLPQTFESAVLEFTHNSIRYYAIYGGLTNEGTDEDLYL